MRVHWIVFVLSTLVSTGVLMIVLAQYQMLSRLREGSEKLRMESKKFNNELLNQDIFQVTVEKLVAQGQKVVEDLEATMVKLNSEMEKKKTENDACQADKKTKNDELAGTEKEHAKTDATLKTESEAWKQEIIMLQAQLTAHSPICDYVKDKTQYQKFCASTNSTTPLTKIKE